MIAVLDYGVGNLFSICCSLKAIGQTPVVTEDEREIARAERILLPGVGAFSDAIGKFRRSGLDQVLMREVQKGKPLMGICLGMQLLFEKSFEFGEHEGLGLVKGNIRPIRDVIPPQLKVPHIGWNRLSFPEGVGGLSPFPSLRDGDWVYFVHSYYAADCPDSVMAHTDYGAPLTAMVGRENIFGCQFHPEKSGSVGLGILKDFCERSVL